MSLAIIVVAAGRGERLGKSQPKAFVEIEGKTILEHALLGLPDSFDELVLVLPEDYFSQAREISNRLGLSPELVLGGGTRQQSVENGLASVKSDLVLVHDSARCFTPTEVFDRVIAELELGSQAVLPVISVSDSIKKVTGNQVIENVDRDYLAAAQTPQGFRTEVLKTSLAQSATMFTDDAAAVLAAGYKIVTVDGDTKSLKITHPSDLATETFIGIGVDSHAFSGVGTLKLGLIEIPQLPSLEGHSDGDAVAHAVVDSLLSAARLGDIGSNFGVDKPEYAGASGELFLKATLDLLSRAGYSVVNVAVQIIADKPKVAPIRDQMQQALSAILKAPVSVTATTTDGLGFLADASGIGAVSTALIKSHG